MDRRRKQGTLKKKLDKLRTDISIKEWLYE